MENNIIAMVPVPSNEIHARSLSAPIDVYQPGNTPDVEVTQPPVPLSHYLWLLRRHWWRILLAVVCAASATLIISLRLVPIYESTATVDIDRQMPSAIIGQESTRPMASDSDQFLATQIKLIQSDAVLRPVVAQYQLQTEDAEGSPDVNAPKISDSDDPPVLLKDLKVVRPVNTYLLLISYRSTNPKLAANVANATARSYLEHTYEIRFKSSAGLSTFMERQLEELKAKMETSSAALAQFERELNVISPEEKTSILSSRLLQLNTEYTNAQGDRVRKESAYSSVAGGSIEAAQVSSQGESLKKLSEQMDLQQQKFVEVKSHFGPNHPEYYKASLQITELARQLEQAKQNIVHRVEAEYRESVTREAMLGKAVAETKTEFDALNARSFEYQAKKRDAEGDKTLYEELVRKIREASINSGFQNNTIRIADTARPARKPVFPNIRLNVLLASLISLLLASGFTVLADMLSNTVRDPVEISRSLSTEVVGTLPAVKEWHGRPSRLGVGVNPASTPFRQVALRTINTFDEAIRTLRNSILLTDFDRRIRTLLVTSSSPSEGKSTIAANLALAHAEQGHRTLLIDGDLRRPSIHRRFDLSPTCGLSNVLSSGVAWRSVLVSSETLATLDILPVGPPSRRAADMVGSRLALILEEAAGEYDLVVLDSPPLLGFPEPLQMAAAVDGVLVVAVAGRTNRKALGSAIGTLKRLRTHIVGIVLNEVHADSSENYYYDHYSPKYYKHYNAPEIGSQG
jgi:succinoglycan biosynthesis transport protein ExoP